MLRVLTLMLYISGCSFQSYKPEPESLISNSTCGHLVGEYSVDSEKFKYYSNPKFWSMRDYQVFSINFTEAGIEFSAKSNNSPVKIKTLNHDEYSCDGKVLTIDVENGATSNGGVSTYDARKLQIFSVKPDEIRMRMVQTSSGLAFLVPVVISEDSLVILNRI